MIRFDGDNYLRWNYLEDVLRDCSIELRHLEFLEGSAMRSLHSGHYSLHYNDLIINEPIN